MTAASFQRVVAAAGARISAAKRKSGMGPRFKLFNRNSAQGFGAGAQAGKGGFGVNARHLSRQSYHAARKNRGRFPISAGGDCLEERRTSAYERHRARVALAGDRPKQLDPFVKHFRQ